MCSAERWMRWLTVAVAVTGGGAVASAGGPRFITGTSGYATAGLPMAWYTNTPQYFTDPGDLSSTVTHAQADAMVAAAAGTWNVPTASMTLRWGGQLAEHVTANGAAQNVYFDGEAVVFPADVMAANFKAMQIAVIYDSDGSVLDTLLGSGASGVGECRQNAVVESVDQFGSSGTIEHAVIVLNGLCVGSDPQQLMQMQYQLTRVFGRVLGLAWSQLNDNVFTGTPQPTAAQMALWPLMHPIDVMCGPYTYQCMQGAFTLRPDDINALVTLYPVRSSGGGKTLSSRNTVSVSGTVQFPTGQGMEIVNVLAYRLILGVDGVYEPDPVYSSTTGIPFQQNGGNLADGVEAVTENAGANVAADEGAWSIPYVVSGPQGAYLYFRTEGINPLYSGEYAAGAYQRPVMTLSGSSQQSAGLALAAGAAGMMTINQTGGSGNWCQYPDSVESGPPWSDATGWWGVLTKAAICSTGYTTWRKTAVNANTSWTIEVTAVNEGGAGTIGKLQPVIGVWNASDAAGTLPTVASEPIPMNSLVLGMTQLRVWAATSAASYRIGIADRFGGGRPDFNYTARVLYASGVVPATLGSGGGQITISGMGFRAGNQVLVNGVAAVVLGWTSTQIVATAPSLAAAKASSGTAVDVEVVDGTTSGNTDMAAALTYLVGTKNLVVLTSSPDALETGVVAAIPFAVTVYAADGVTPAQGANVIFKLLGSGGGSAVATGCGTGSGCVLATNAAGLAQTPLKGVAAGSVTVSATEVSGGASVTASLPDTNPVQTVTIGGATQYLASGAAGRWGLSLTAMQDGAAAADVGVTWTALGSGFALTPATGVTLPDGSEAVVAGVGAIGDASTNTVWGCAWTSVCASWTVYGVAASQWVLGMSSAGGQSVSVAVAPAVVALQVTDGAGHALPGATANVFQAAYAKQGICGLQGRCAAAPVLMVARSTAVSDANGMVQVTPIEVQGVAQVVKIAVAAGMKGFATTWVTVGP